MSLGARRGEEDEISDDRAAERAAVAGGVDGRGWRGGADDADGLNCEEAGSQEGQGGSGGGEQEACGEEYRERKEEDCRCGPQHNPSDAFAEHEQHEAQASGGCTNTPEH
jgi:hypothetical protein